MKKYLFGIFAIALAVTFTAFTSQEKVSTDVWVYQLTTEEGAFEADNYVFETAPSCSGSAIPCTIDRGITTSGALQTYLSSKNDIEDLLDDAGVVAKQ
jgi:hypothetical protein